MNKNILLCLGSFSAGGAAVFLNDVVLFPYWLELNWRKPVQDWLLASGNETTAGYWSLLWVNLPEYVAALAFGVVIGLVAHHRWAIAAVFGSVGFILVPHLASLFVPTGHQWPFKVAVTALLWDFVAVLLLFGGAWLGQRIRRSKSGGTSPHAVPPT